MSKNSGKSPSYQMYPRDWNEDVALKLCSFAAQGFWIRLINTSFDMPEPGVFILNSTPLHREFILHLIAGSPREKGRLFNELLKMGVLKQRESDKAFYCKRLAKDMRLSKVRKEAGKQGGNPEFEQGKPNPYYPKKDKQKDKQKITPSSSSSSSSSFNANSNNNEGVNNNAYTNREIKPPPQEDDFPEIQFPPKDHTIPDVQPMTGDEKEICHAWARAKNLPGMEALPSRELSHLSQHLGRLLRHATKAEVLAEIETTLRPTAGWWINDMLERASKARASPGSAGMSDVELLDDFRAMEKDLTYGRR